MDVTSDCTCGLVDSIQLINYWVEPGKLKSSSTYSEFKIVVSALIGLRSYIIFLAKQSNVKYNSNQGVGIFIQE